MVDLNRSPEYTDHNIPTSADNYYRSVSVDSFDDLWRQAPDGDTMFGYGKGGTNSLSFQAEYPNNIYVNGPKPSNMIIEGGPTLPIIRQESESGYTYVTPLKRSEVESGEVPLRVYMRKSIGETALRSVNQWSLVFNSFPDTEA